MVATVQWWGWWPAGLGLLAETLSSLMSQDLSGCSDSMGSMTWVLVIPWDPRHGCGWLPGVGDSMRSDVDVTNSLGSLTWGWVIPWDF